MNTPAALADRAPARRALTADAIAALLPEVPRWQLVQPEGAPSRLRSTLAFRDFGGALTFANRVGLVADQLDHHPDLHVSWGKLVIEVWTHDAGGLSEADFVLAARIDRLVVDATPAADTRP